MFSIALPCFYTHKKAQQKSLLGERPGIKTPAGIIDSSRKRKYYSNSQCRVCFLGTDSRAKQLAQSPQKGFLAESLSQCHPLENDKSRVRREVMGVWLSAHFP